MVSFTTVVHILWKKLVLHVLFLYAKIKEDSYYFLPLEKNNHFIYNNHSCYNTYKVSF